MITLVAMGRLHCWLRATWWKLNGFMIYASDFTCVVLRIFFALFTPTKHVYQSYIRF